MSIDRGKLLTEIEHEITAMATKVDVTVRLGRASNIMAKVRALAQPAEAVEAQVAEAAFKAGAIAMADRLIDRLAEEADGCSIESPQAKAYYAALDARKSHDAAQGAVADVSLTARKLLADQFPHQITKDLLVIDGRTDGVVDTTLALAAIEDALRTHPQAAPAQGDGDITFVDSDADVRWAVDQWHMQVAQRPLVNRHRRSLDDVWRQVIRHFGGDDVMLCGPCHDDLLAAAPSQEPRERKWYDEGEPVDESKVSNQAQEPRS